jgi:hypothetical protein
MEREKYMSIGSNGKEYKNKLNMIFSIIGLIGFILLIAGGVTVVNSSGIDYFSQRQVGLNLAITGAIFLALAIAFFTRKCASCGQCCL